MSSLVTGVLGLLLVAVTVVGIVTAAHDNHNRPPANFQGTSGMALYGGR